MLLSPLKRLHNQDHLLQDQTEAHLDHLLINRQHLPRLLLISLQLAAQEGPHLLPLKAGRGLPLLEPEDLDVVHLRVDQHPVQNRSFKHLH